MRKHGRVASRYQCNITTRRWNDNSAPSPDAKFETDWYLEGRLQH